MMPRRRETKKVISVSAPHHYLANLSRLHNREKPNQSSGFPMLRERVWHSEGG